MGMILGHNGYQYKVNEHWVQNNRANYPVNDCHEMVQARSGLLYLLTNETKNNILIYNRDGEIKGSWGNEFPGGHGLSIHNENGTEFLYITDTVRHKVFKTSLTGRVIFEIDFPKEIGLYQSADEFKPTETLIATNGDIYITDGYGHQFVVQYNAKGEYLRHWGGKGPGKEHFDCVHGIALDNRKKGLSSLLITSRNENCIKRFSLEGEYINKISLPGSFVCRPVVYHNNIYAAVFRSGDNQNYGSGFITILDEYDKVISSPGASEPIYHNYRLLPQRQLSKIFIHPHDVCIDQDENIYVPQWNSNRTHPLMLSRIG